MQQKLLILRINIGKNGKNNNIMATKKQEKQETQVAILTPKKVRGTATIYACGDVEFKAYGEGKPGLANWTWSVRVSRMSLFLLVQSYNAFYA